MPGMLTVFTERLTWRVGLATGSVVLDWQLGVRWSGNCWDCWIDNWECWINNWECWIDNWECWIGKWEWREATWQQYISDYQYQHTVHRPQCMAYQHRTVPGTGVGEGSTEFLFSRYTTDLSASEEVDK